MALKEALETRNKFLEESENVIWIASFRTYQNVLRLFILRQDFAQQKISNNRENKWKK